MRPGGVDDPGELGVHGVHPVRELVEAVLDPGELTREVAGRRGAGVGWLLADQGVGQVPRVQVEGDRDRFEGSAVAATLLKWFLKSAVPRNS